MACSLARASAISLCRRGLLGLVWIPARCSALALWTEPQACQRSPGQIGKFSCAQDKRSLCFWDWFARSLGKVTPRLAGFLSALKGVGVLCEVIREEICLEGMRTGDEEN